MMNFGREPKKSEYDTQFIFKMLNSGHKAPPWKGGKSKILKRRKNQKTKRREWNQPQILWGRKAYIGTCNYAIEAQGEKYRISHLIFHVMSHYNYTTT